MSRARNRSRGTAAIRPQPLWAALAVALGTAAILWLMGRPPICRCGTVELWVASTSSAKTSQMLADWYSTSHVLHGILFFAAFALILRRVSVERRFLLAVALEAAWELIENSPVIINRYRHATVAVGYTGDSILNSMSDIAMMGLGFWLARKLPWQATLVIAIVLELVPLAVIRDNLLLNVWQLIAPNAQLRAWQAGG
jgi:Protein of unknown function (DUF2585)